jgi:hypothetical protein
MSIMVALFLIVVVASLAAFAVTVGANHRQEASHGLMQDRALSAARAGVEYASYRARLAPPCPANTIINLNEGALRGFRVSVDCQESGVVPNNVWRITSTATYGNYGAPGYVRREVSARIAP